MAILAAGRRRYLFDKKQIYIFSYDLTFDTTLSYVDWFGEDLRLHLVGPRPPETAGAVFHVLDERTVMGHDSFLGAVSSFEENVFVPRDGEAAVTNGRMILRAEDGDVLCSWDGVLQLGPFGCKSLHSGKSDDANLPTKVKAMITSRFESPNQKYSWLAEHLCAGFGTVTIKQGEVISAKFDIYAID